MDLFYTVTGMPLYAMHKHIMRKVGTPWVAVVLWHSIHLMEGCGLVHYIFSTELVHQRRWAARVVREGHGSIYARVRHGKSKYVADSQSTLLFLVTCRENMY